MSKMRKIAKTKAKREEACWLILYAVDTGVYIFPCESEFDGSGAGDYWFEDVGQANLFALEAFGVEREDWIAVDEPLPGCQHDWITPTRIENKGTRKSIFHCLIDGEWQPLSQIQRPKFSDMV